MKNRNHFSVMIIFVVLLSVMLASCSLQRRCERRLAFLENNCPNCFTTVTVRDTIIREGWKHDTAFVLSHDTLPDTFYIEKEKVSVRIVRHTDTLLATVESDPDTVYIERAVSVPHSDKEKVSGWARVSAWLGSLLLLSVLGWIVVVKSRK